MFPSVPRPTPRPRPAAAAVVAVCGCLFPFGLATRLSWLPPNQPLTCPQPRVGCQEPVLLSPPCRRAVCRAKGEVVTSPQPACSPHKVVGASRSKVGRFRWGGRELESPSRLSYRAGHWSGVTGELVLRIGTCKGVLLALTASPCCLSCRRRRQGPEEQRRACSGTERRCEQDSRLWPPPLTPTLAR